MSNNIPINILKNHLDTITEWTIPYRIQNLEWKKENNIVSISTPTGECTLNKTGSGIWELCDCKHRVFEISRGANPTINPTYPRHINLGHKAILGDDYGITGPHGDTVVVDWDVCLNCSDNKWYVRVNSVTSAIDSERRLPHGVTQVVVGLPPAGNTTAADYCKQVQDLDAIGQGAGIRWYDIAAVNAHEDVHIQEWIDCWNAEWPNLETILENLSVAADNTVCTPAQARAQLQSTGEGLAEAAERPIVDALIQQICNLAEDQAGWPVCAVCP